MKNFLSHSLVVTSNHAQFGLTVLALAVVLNSCNTTKPVQNSKQISNKTSSQNALPQERSKHQADHGADASHRAAFIDEYDLNGDKEVTHAEFMQARAAKLKAMDSNNNGLVDEAEYLDHFASELEKKINSERKEEILQTEIRFKSIDKNADGKMIWDEYWASGMRTFTHFAKSADGVVTLTAKDKEWDAAPDSDQKNDDANSQSLDNIIRPAIINMPSSHSLSGFIEINDLNGDQQVTAEEFRQVRRGIFDTTDTNHDGWISPEEYTFEFTNRLDRQIKQIRTAQMSQAKVRYGVLNTNQDAGISPEEFNASGERIFNGWDLNNDGKVSVADPLPQIKNEYQKAAPAKPAAK